MINFYKSCLQTFPNKITEKIDLKFKVLKQDKTIKKLSHLMNWNEVFELLFASKCLKAFF